MINLLVGIALVLVLLLLGVSPTIAVPIGLGVAVVFTIGQRLGNRLSESTRDRTFFVFFALYTTVAIVWLIVGLTPVLVHALPGLHRFIHDAGRYDRTLDLGVTSAHYFERFGFPVSESALLAEETVTVSLVNDDPEHEHNWSLYRDSAHMDAVFRGEAFGPSDRRDYTFLAPGPGTYYFRSDIHPDMQGVIVFGTPESTYWSGFLQRIATISHDIPASRDIVLFYGISLLNLGLGIFLIRLRPHDRTSRLLALGMVGTAVGFNFPSHHSEFITMELSIVHIAVLHPVSGLAYIYALLIFPDGKLLRTTSSKRLALAGRNFYLLFFTMVGFIVGFVIHGEPVGFVIFFGIVVPITGVSAQIWRYRTAQTAEERQQSKALLLLLSFALIASLIFGSFLALADAVWQDNAMSHPSSIGRIAFQVFPPLFAVIPVTLFIILIRYRLWDIDRVLNRALVYGIVSGILGISYLGLVILFQQLFHAFTGQGSAVAVALSTLAIAALFSPLRDRIQVFIDRRFNRRRYDSAQAVSAFAMTLRDEVDLDHLTQSLTRVVGETVQPQHVSLWLRPPEQATGDT